MTTVKLIEVDRGAMPYSEPQMEHLTKEIRKMEKKFGKLICFSPLAKIGRTMGGSPETYVDYFMAVFTSE